MKVVGVGQSVGRDADFQLFTGGRGRFVVRIFVVGSLVLVVCRIRGRRVVFVGLIVCAGCAAANKGKHHDQRQYHRE